MATSSPVTLFNTDPNIQAQAAILQQRQALAQALQAEGMRPMDTSNRSIGGVAYRISPFEGLGKLAQAVSGQKMMRDTVGQQAQLAAQAYGNLLQRYQPGTDPQFTPGQMQGAEQAGMPSNQMGPPDPTKMAQYLQGQTPSGGVNPNNPMGIPAPILAQRNGGMMDDETFKALTSGYGATDATKAALQGGLDPQNANRAAFQKAQTDPKIFAMQQAGFTPQQIYAAQYGEAAKASDVERRPDQMFSNSFTGERGFVPKIPEGSNPVGVPGANGAIPGVSPMPGAAPIIQRNAQASSTGSANGGFQNVTMPDGSQRPIRGGEVPSVSPQPGVQGNFTGNPEAVAAAIANIKDPQERANAQAAFDSQMRANKGVLRLGQSTADKVTQEAGAKVMTDLPMQLQQSRQTVTGLENAYRSIEAVGKSGPGVSKTVNALAILNNMGVPVASGDTNGFQTLKKFLENSASTAAASNGFTGSDARFEQFKSGQPNAETMNPDALKGAIRYVLSQHDANIARAQFIQQQVQSNQGDPNAAMKAQQQWSQSYSPRVFEFSRMTPQERAQTKSGMSEAQRQKFGQQYNFAHQQGWVQ